MKLSFERFILKNSFVILFLVFMLSHAYAVDKTEPYTEELDFYTLEEYLNQKVVTPSLYEQHTTEAPSNVIIITKEIIERRGYQNLVEICRDIPGFDFATFDDGGGEYPIHNILRGVGGDPGNPKILIMVDGIIQNFINFNWSTLWTNEQMLHDVERIEIIQGPGSALHGANAYSGIINFITKKNFEGVYTKAWYGQNNSRSLDIHIGETFNKVNISFAVHKYDSDGDSGDRHDPGNYFHNNTAPGTLTQYYSDGIYQIDVPNPYAGTTIPDGFKTNKDDLSFRLKLISTNSEFGFFFWERKDGLGSYIVGYEYYSNESDKLYQVHHRGYHIYGKNSVNLSDSVELRTILIYRVTQQMPETGFIYTYRFTDMPKTYHSFSYQGSVEEQIHYSLHKNHQLIAGFKFQRSLKMNQIVSLNEIQDPYSSTTNSSYDEAVDGNGLNQSKSVDTLSSKEYAGFLLWDARFTEWFFSTIGARYDKSSEYGSTTNPRIGLIFNTMNIWTLKLLYGSAFRQPSIFELTDEWRGYRELKPEKITTYEVENSFRVSRYLNIRLNTFYSIISDIITVVEDPSRTGGERYDNVGKSWVYGYSVTGDIQIHKGIYIYFNYILTEGKKEEEKNWREIEHVAKHKVNFGINWLTLKNHLNINMRCNYVGRIKAPDSNTWIQNHEGGYAPEYFLANLVITLRRLFKRVDLTPQIIIQNIFNEKYYGLGRQSGSGDRDQYDPVSNINPIGFIPAYHPQPGRTIMFNLRFTL